MENVRADEPQRPKRGERGFAAHHPRMGLTGQLDMRQLVQHASGRFDQEDGEHDQSGAASCRIKPAQQISAE